MEIAFTLEKPEQVEIVIFDLRGRLVARLLQESRTAGRHSVVWEGRDLRGSEVASGSYFARFKAGGFEAQRRLTLVR